MEGVDDSDRLYCDLEFVQNLSNVPYLHSLAQNKYLEDDAFLLYLRYLRYWKEPSYQRLLRFPHCLAFLDALIDNEEFRQELAKPGFADYAHAQQGLDWSCPVKVKAE